MRIILEDIPNEDASKVLAQVRQLGYAVRLEGEADIPAWHKEGIDRIRTQTPPEAYTPLDAFLREWESE